MTIGPGTEGLWAGLEPEEVQTAREVRQEYADDYRPPEQAIGRQFADRRIWSVEGVAGVLAKELIEESLLPRPSIRVTDRGHELLLRRTQHDGKIEENKTEWNLLRQYQEYRFETGGVSQGISLQIFPYPDFRLMAFAPRTASSKVGMLFSVNLSVGMSDNNPDDFKVLLSQRLALKHHPPRGVDPRTFAEYKQQRLTQLRQALRQVGLFLDEERKEVVLGYFDPNTGGFTNHANKPQSAQDFVTAFLLASVVFGHFRDNKGYQLPWLQPARTWGQAADEDER